MRLTFTDDRLLRLAQDQSYTAGYCREIVLAYRKRIQFIRSAADEQDLRNWRSLRLEKLKGKRAHQWSIRLNDQWRMILEFKRDAAGKVVVVISIEDYH